MESVIRPIRFIWSFVRFTGLVFNKVRVEFHIPDQNGGRQKNHCCSDLALLIRYCYVSFVLLFYGHPVYDGHLAALTRSHLIGDHP